MDETKLADAVRRLAVVFERRHIRHALIGGLAVGIRSRPRATKDADFILHAPALSFPGVLEELAADGFEIDVLDIVRRWSEDRLVVFYRGPVRIVWMQPIVPHYAHVLIRNEWSSFALTEPERTAWLEAAIIRNVPLRG